MEDLIEVTDADPIQSGSLRLKKNGEVPFTYTLDDEGETLRLSIGTYLPRHLDGLEFKYGVRNPQVQEIDEALIPKARTVEELRSNYTDPLKNALMELIPPDWPYARAAHGYIQVVNIKQNAPTEGGEGPDATLYISTIQVKTSVKRHLMAKDRRGTFKGGVRSFVNDWLSSLITTIDKLTNTASGQTQIGISNISLTLNRNDGINLAGAWTGTSDAKQRWPHSSHGIVDSKPKKHLPDSCFLNAFLTPHYINPSNPNLVSSGYKVKDGRLVIPKTRFKQELNGLDVSMLIEGCVDEGQIDLFEAKNPTCKVSVWEAWSDGEFPRLMRPSNNPDGTVESQVLLTESSDGEAHFVGLRNGISPLMSHNHNKSYPCTQCGHIWSNESAMLCCGCEEPNLKRKFKETPCEPTDAAYADMNDIVIVADLESSGVERQEVIGACVTAYSPATGRLVSMHKPTQEGEPVMFASTVKGQVVKELMQLVGHFAESVKRLKLQRSRDLRKAMSKEQEQKFDDDRKKCKGVCPSCKQDVGYGSLVPDHDHNMEPGAWTYREPLCSPCNFKKRVMRTIPILFHNGSGYDWVRIQDDLSNIINRIPECPCDDCAGEKFEITNVLSKTATNWLSFSMRKYREESLSQCPAIIKGKRCAKAAKDCEKHTDATQFDSTPRYITKKTLCGIPLKFLDTLKFRKASLDTLAKELKSFPLMRQAIQDDELFEIAQRKGVYPYELPYEEWADRTDFPPIETFYSKLRQGNVSEEEYQYAQRVHNTLTRLGKPTFKDYMEFYCMVDTLLLADISLNLQRNMWKLGRLDPFNFVTISSMGYHHMLKRLKEQNEILETPPNQEVWEIWQQGKSGGFCSVGQVYAKANHPLLSDYDPSKPESVLDYTDQTGLYPSTIRKFQMPFGDHKYITDQDELKRLTTDMPHYSELINEKIGHTIDCDIHYCCKLHNEFTVSCSNCRHVHDINGRYPICPRPRDILLSELSTEQLNRHERKEGVSGNRLVADLLPKRISISAIALSYYLERGYFKITKLHGAASYKHSWAMKAVLDELDEMRRAAETKSENQLLKLIANGIPGFTMQNKASHISMEVCSEELTPEQLRKKRRACSNLFDVTYGDLRYFAKSKGTITEDLPSQIGIAIYDLSKLMMRISLDRITDALEPQGFTVNEVYTDTDSYILHMEGEGVTDAWIEFQKKNGDMFVHNGVFPEWHDLGKLTDNTKRPWTLECERPVPDSWGRCSKDCKGCEICDALQQKYKGLPSILSEVICVGPKNYKLTDATPTESNLKAPTKVTCRGIMKRQRSEAAESTAYEDWHANGTSYKAMQPRLGHTSIRGKDADLRTGVLCTENPRVVIPDRYAEKGFLHADGTYLPFGNYRNN